MLSSVGLREGRSRCLPAGVRIVEVGPRDGLQNEQTVPLDARVQLIDQLADAGVKTIECGSFVSPQWVPQMAESCAVLSKIQRRAEVRYSALVPNQKGLELALACGVDEIAVFVSASESFSRANLNCSIAESMRRIEPVLASAQKFGIRVRGYLSCVWGCPFEGDVAIARAASVASDLRDLGCFEVSLSDTIGVGTPLRVQRAIEELAQRIPIEQLAVHFHDTYGQALANLLVAVDLGVGVIDCSVAGLGGCPYAPGAAGNVATEDVVYLLEGMGIETGIDLDRLAAAGRNICAVLNRQPASKAALALAAAENRTSLHEPRPPNNI